MFVTSCRQCAACRNDPRTLATVALNSAKRNPEGLVFRLFGPFTIRFFINKCVKDVYHACQAAIWVAVRHANPRAVGILAPLCDQTVVEQALREWQGDMPFVIESLKYLNVPPDLAAKTCADTSAINDTFDAVRHFDRTGEFPAQTEEFVKFANQILSCDHIGWLERMVMTLEETDASGSLKLANVDRVVALLETLPEFGTDELFERFMSEHCENYCGVAQSSRPFAVIVARLFAIAPRPLTLEQKLGMIRASYFLCDFKQVKLMFTPGEEEAKTVFDQFMMCSCQPDCITERQQRFLKLWAVAYLPSDSLEDDGYEILAACVLLDSGDYDSMFQLLARLNSHGLASADLELHDAGNQNESIARHLTRLDSKTAESADLELRDAGDQNESIARHLIRLDSKAAESADLELRDAGDQNESIARILARLDSQAAESTVVEYSEDALLSESGRALCDSNRQMLESALLCLNARGELDVWRIVNTLLDALDVYNRGWTFTLTILILLHKNGLLAHEDFSESDDFDFESNVDFSVVLERLFASKLAWRVRSNGNTDMARAVSSGAFADFMLTLCREHGEIAAMTDMTDDEKYPELIKQLRKIWPSEFEACLEDCLRIARDNNDAVLVSMLNSTPELEK